MKTRRAESRARQPRWLGRMFLAGGFLIISVSPAFADFQSGLAAYAENEYEAAFREWLPLAEQGDALAQLYVARMYEDGRGVRRSFGDARGWYDRAAATFPPGENQDRAVRGRDRMVTELDKKRVDPGLVGTWRLTAPDPGGGAPSESLLEINDAGDFWLKTTRADSSRSETGTFSASDGKWRWKSPNEEQEGTYEIVHSDAIKLTDILGTAEWTRVGAIAQQPIDILDTFRIPRARDFPEKPGLGSWPEEFSPAAEVPQTTEPPVTGGRVLFEDDFQSQRQWPEQSGDSCKTSYGDGGFVLENIAQEGFCGLLVGGDEFLAGVRIEVSARFRRGDQNYQHEDVYGLMFGSARDGSSYYKLAISKGGDYIVSLYQDRKWITLLDWTQDPAIKPGYDSINRLAVELHGPTIKAYINDEHVGSTEAPAAIIGAIGLYIDAPGTEAVFSDLRVTELVPTGPATEVSPEPPDPPVEGQ